MAELTTLRRRVHPMAALPRMAGPVLAVCAFLLVLAVRPCPAGEDQVIFRDDFTGSLQPGWTWIRENPATWQMTPSTLRIELEYGDLWSTWTNNCRNLLIRPAPTEDFTLEVRLIASLVANINQAHVLLYADDNNYLRFGLLRYQGNLYVNHVQEVGGTPRPQTSHAYGSGEVYLRIEKQGGQAKLWFSADSLSWNEHLTIGSLDFVPTSVGLVAFDGSEPASASVADYDYVTILSGALSRIAHSDATPPRLGLAVRGNPVRAGELVHIEFAAPTAGRASLRVFDVLGTQVATIMDKEVPAGRHLVGWSPPRGPRTAENTPAGLYFLRLSSSGAQATARVVVTR